ncbi:MAG: Short-chain dehydrogenase/reductase, family [Microbacteriaceae bacterium]|nr:Short-chain dehydrogenase/reductase, family [Microbacteriaceae bacterium]
MSSDKFVQPDLTEVPLEKLWSLAGKVAVVTGGASGIGAAIVRRYAEAGARVVIGDMNLELATKVAAEVAAATGATVEATLLNITDSKALRALAEECVSDRGGLDIWVNNAGIYPPTGDVLEASDEHVALMLDVNVRGTFMAAREAARAMTNGGVIVNIASTSGFRASRGTSAYIMSKHAVVGLTKSLAIELGERGIRVVGIAPAVTTTPGTDAAMIPLKAAGYDLEAKTRASLMGRLGLPDDIARVAVFVASDMAAWVTGSTVAADSGLLASAP